MELFGAYEFWSSRLTWFIFRMTVITSVNMRSLLCNIQALRLRGSAAFLPAFAGKLSSEGSMYNDNFTWPYAPQLIFQVHTRFHCLCMCRRWRWGVVSTVCEAVHTDSSRLAPLHDKGMCWHGLAPEWNVWKVLVKGLVRWIKQERGPEFSVPQRETVMLGHLPILDPHNASRHSWWTWLFGSRCFCVKGAPTLQITSAPISTWDKMRPR